MWTRTGKIEWLRRYAEQIDLVKVVITKLEHALETKTYTGWQQYHMVDGKPTKDLLTDTELRADLAKRLAEAKSHLPKLEEQHAALTKVRPEEPAIVIPKALARAMNRLRKRTRSLMRKKAEC